MAEKKRMTKDTSSIAHLRKLLVIAFVPSLWFVAYLDRREKIQFLQTTAITKRMLMVDKTTLPPPLPAVVEVDAKGENDEKPRNQRLAPLAAVIVTKLDTKSFDDDQPRNQRLAPLSRMPQNPEAALQLIQEARQGQRATFLQIGANNGQMFDPLYPHFIKDNNKKKWIGLQVEPQPELYGSLAVLHADAPDWAFYLGAVASLKFCMNGRIQFCETKTPGQGNWTTQGQVNSVAAHCNAKTMHFQQRPCVTNFDDLIYQHASPVFLQHAMQTELSQNDQYHSIERSYNVDLLQIDVEGKDYDVLSLIDWKQLHPTCIAYEQMHLGENQQAAKDLLRDMGYTIKDRVMDVLACQVERKFATNGE